MAHGSNQADREVRIALVLYGGVSLAVYENGVTRCFFDLVKRRGIFEIILDVLQAKATVDVVAGTSAGGINGLLLAAALESGAEFKSSADLWRRLGDFGDLLRPVSEAEEARSLLSGESYYGELVRAFEGICRMDDPAYESPGEMDVFITGTDLNGHAQRYRDGLGSEIEDKQHRVVFHLEHRPGRKSLGISREKIAVSASEQAALLGAIARITSSFPIAFPPFKLDDVKASPDIKAEIAKALDVTSGIAGIASHSLVDGGVLANKPFGPVLEAIFHRMPEGPVDRYLFYLEPDPEPRLDSARPREHTPLGVGIASLTTVPAHQSIGNDLDVLERHNARIRWLRDLQALIRRTWETANSRRTALSPAYANARIESVARSLVFEGDSAPSASDYPTDGARAALLASLTNELTKRMDGELRYLDPYDVTYQLRLAFRVLYDLYERAARDGGPELRTAMQRMGRVVITLKAVRDLMIRLRDRVVPRLFEAGQDALSARMLLDVFVEFLSVDGPQWKALVPQLRKACEPPRGVDHEEVPFLSTTDLTNAVQEAKAAIEAVSLIPSSADRADFSESDSILSLLEQASEGILRACGLTTLMDELRAVDWALYPLEFASGVYSLDEIRFVRISPDDAQVGHSHGDPHEKIAGDELAHFSAFLRREWRSNDILQGRLDGICQIISTLMVDESLARVLGNRTSSAAICDPNRLAKVLPCAQHAQRARVTECWQRLQDSWEGAKQPVIADWNDDIRSQARGVREALIVAAQEDAFQEELPGILADLRFQETRFGIARTKSATSETAVELTEVEAASAAVEDVARLNAAGQAWQRFREMRLGAQHIAGPSGRLPNSIIGEYASLAYLHLWGMLQGSVSRTAKMLLNRRTVRLLLRTPVALLYRMLFLARRDRVTAALAFGLGLGLLLGAGSLAIWYKHWGAVAFCVLLVILIAMLGIRFEPRSQPHAK
ncbi:patatin-like protein [Candidatus Uhrbacteria bacterium]|nr:patatin-like protein [Candidatus Uhrbacteria bacterium]